jgi:hypothetical protein
MNEKSEESLPAARALTRRGAIALGAASAATLMLRPLASPGDAVAADGTEAFTLRVPGAAFGPGGTSRPVSPGRAFSLVGLLDPGRHPAVEVRARREGGSWTSWAPMRESVDHGPDGGGRPLASEPVWTGPCDEVQLRAGGRVGGTLRLQFVEVPAAAGARAAARPVKVSQSQPEIVPRSAWGGGSVPPRTRPSFGRVIMAFVHHTEGVNNYSAAQSASIVLGIARYHRDGRGWNDIGYNFLVDRFGRIFEGRAGGITMPVIGAQAGGWNSVSTGVAILGSFTGNSAPRAAVEAVGALLGWKLALHGVPPSGTVEIVSAGGSENRWPNGRTVKFQRIVGHRDGCSTDCPGSLLYAQLPAIRSLAAQQGELTPPEAYVTLVGPRTVVWGKAGRLRGAVTNGDKTAKAGEKVRLEVQLASGRWKRFATVTAGSDGSWSHRVVVRSSVVLRARAAGVESSPIAVEVKPKLSASAGSNQVTAGGRVRVSGVARPSGPVEVLVERRTGRRWVRVALRTARARPRFSVSVKLPRSGRHRITVRATRGSRTTSLKPIAVEAMPAPAIAAPPA